MSAPLQIGTAAFVRIAVDIGGTFTDIQVLDEESGACFAHKVASRPDDPAVALIDGLQQSTERFGFDLSQVSMLIHGTTIATNAVLERKLPMGALVTTSGFEDVLEIGRHLRRDVYANRAEPRSLLIPRSRRFGVVERIRADGRAEGEPALDELKVLASNIAESGAETLAVCCLNAHVNSDHERAIAAAIASELPTLPISLSSDISPEFREFERTSTTVLNALLMPVVGDYLARLEDLLRGQGLMAPVYLVQSNGGVATPEIAVSQPARLLLSGPSGGARAAEILAGSWARKIWWRSIWGALATTFPWSKTAVLGSLISGKSTAVPCAFPWWKCGPLVPGVVLWQQPMMGKASASGQIVPGPIRVRPVMVVVGNAPR